MQDIIALIIILQGFEIIFIYCKIYLQNWGFIIRHTSNFMFLFALMIMKPLSIRYQLNRTNPILFVECFVEGYKVPDNSYTLFMQALNSESPTFTYSTSFS